MWVCQCVPGAESAQSHSPPEAENNTDRNIPAGPCIIGNLKIREKHTCNWEPHGKRLWTRRCYRFQIIYITSWSNNVHIYDVTVDDGSGTCLTKAVPHCQDGYQSAEEPYWWSATKDLRGYSVFLLLPIRWRCSVVLEEAVACLRINDIFVHLIVWFVFMPP